jgi:hypothetical protein
VAVNLSLLAGAGWQFFTNNGDPLTGGKLYTYAAGTTSPQATFTSVAGATANANPIILNAAGRLNGSGEIWLSEGVTYKFVLTDSNDVLIGTYDNIPGANDSFAVYAALSNTSDPAKGDALIGFRQSNASGNLPNAVGRTVHQKLQEAVSVKDFGAVGDGVTNDTAAIQAAMDAVSEDGGGDILIPAGDYMVSTLIPRDYVTLVGEGRYVTYLRQIVGTNATMIASSADLRGFRAFDFSTNGNYFIGAWNDNPGVLGNTSGGGVDIKPISCELDIAINNHAGIGCLIRNADVPSLSAEYDVQTVISVEGKDFGKEGLIIAGMPDGIVQKVFLGRCGILPRPTADTQLAVSSYYPGDPVDGVVVDDRNIEFQLVHVYACWSGTGFRTRDSVRLTGGEIISESNLQQVNLSVGTYGSAKFDGRRFGLLHPNWTAPIPAYDAAKHDAFYIQAETGFLTTITAHALIVPVARVPDTNIVNIIGDDNNVNISYRGTSPTSSLDPDFPGRYKHTVLKLSPTARGNYATVTAANARGAPVVLDDGESNTIVATMDAPVGSGVTADGANANITATVRGQTQDGGVGAALTNTGTNSTWVISSAANAVPYASSGSPGRTTVFGSNAAVRQVAIAGGVLALTVFDQVVEVDTEGGAATDDLDNITGCSVSQIIYLRGAAGKTITLNKNAGGTGNIRLNVSTSTRVLSSVNDYIQMIADGTNVAEVAYADNG